jgi:hypothetical protein
MSYDPIAVSLEQERIQQELEQQRVAQQQEICRQALQQEIYRQALQQEISRHDQMCPRFHGPSPGGVPCARCIAEDEDNGGLHTPTDIPGLYQPTPLDIGDNHQYLTANAGDAVNSPEAPPSSTIEMRCTRCQEPTTTGGVCPSCQERERVATDQMRPDIPAITSSPLVEYAGGDLPSRQVPFAPPDERVCSSHQGHRYVLDVMDRPLMAEGWLRADSVPRRSRPDQEFVSGPYRGSMHASHLIAARFGGDKGAYNMVPFPPEANQQFMGSVENSLADRLKDNDVYLQVYIRYADVGDIPIDVTYRVFEMKEGLFEEVDRVIVGFDGTAWRH